MSEVIFNTREHDIELLVIVELYIWWFLQENSFPISRHKNSRADKIRRINKSVFQSRIFLIQIWNQIQILIYRLLRSRSSPQCHMKIELELLHRGWSDHYAIIIITYEWIFSTSGKFFLVFQIQLLIGFLESCLNPTQNFGQPSSKKLELDSFIPRKDLWIQSDWFLRTILYKFEISCPVNFVVNSCEMMKSVSGEMIFCSLFLKNRKWRY